MNSKPQKDESLGTAKLAKFAKGEILLGPTGNLLKVLRDLCALCGTKISVLVAIK